MPRVLGKKIKIDKEETKSFFKGRKKRLALNPLTAVIYQDKNPKLAEERDIFEKQKILSLMEFSKKDNVLDIACGIGRWAGVLAPRVKTYLGIDYSEDFINFAIENNKKYSNAKFQVLDVIDLGSKALKEKRFSKILIAGLLLYLNDDEVKRFFNNLLEVVSSETKIYLREPLAIDNRLSLRNIWSEELEQKYSAIYRTKEELMAILSEFLLSFHIDFEGDMYDQKLNNRKETKQYLFIFSKND